MTTYPRPRAPGRAILLAVALALAACGSSEQRAVELAQRAEGYFQAGDLENARKTALEATAARDDIAAIWSLLGRIEVQARNYGAALTFYSRANELDRSDVEALQTVAEISFLAGRMRDTDRYADQLLALNPGNLRALLLKGGVALAADRDEDALRLAEQVLATDASIEDARLLKTRALAADKRQDEAIAYLEGELALRGDSLASLNELLGLYRERRDAAAVDRTFRRLLSLDPNSTDTRLAYVTELYRRGLDDQAFQEADALRRDRPDDGAVMNSLANLWRETGRDPVPAATLLDMGIGGTLAQKLAFGTYALDAGRPADALRIVEGAAGPDTISYANVEAQAIVARAEEALGRTADARARVDRIRAFDPGNPRGLVTHVRLLVGAGRLDEALRDGQVLVRDNPTIADGYILLNDIYLRRGEPRLAESRLREGRSALPADARLAERLAAFLIERDRLVDAVRTGRQFVDANPGDPRGWRLRAALCARAGDRACVDEARAAVAQISGPAPARGAAS